MNITTAAHKNSSNHTNRKRMPSNSKNTRLTDRYKVESLWKTADSQIASISNRDIFVAVLTFSLSLKLDRSEVTALLINLP